jgi:hypothetical protein
MAALPRGVTIAALFLFVATMTDVFDAHHGGRRIACPGKKLLRCSVSHPLLIKNFLNNASSRNSRTGDTWLEL